MENFVIEDVAEETPETEDIEKRGWYSYVDDDDDMEKRSTYEYGTFPFVCIIVSCMTRNASRRS
ncbi:hypothetical protein K503DRAFT_492654 [Rhizopogon vinicolor AM-OR11-026]|uniref:Uncharacterized protein n=1 Tax=Rhizopogon vinicolor AM-OR11-026 TaxID=1314800 RepID=A0A1B7MMF7_9AGAM|nr:hypothetical protein K503DRAFT_492654 [Rhizopogon vinicolor AM-OR11-026]